MAEVKNNYQLLINRLDQFTRKYYINKLIRGALYSVALIVVLFLAMSLLEHYFYFGQGMRKTLFYSFLATSGVALLFWVLMPLLSYFRLGKVISHEQASQIIGHHFTDVKDKLLNILQLSKQSEGNSNAALIYASIDQKTEEIKPIPFTTAINLGQNRKYLRYALPPLLLLVVLLFAAPSMIKDSTSRLINNNKDFEKAAPFHFSIEKEALSVVQFDDYNLKVKIDGDILPNEVFIDIDNYQYRLNKDSANLFSYRFSNVQKATDFKVFSGAVNSDDYTLEVLKKPNIVGFETKLDYPAYTQRKDEALANIGDLVIPQGTNIDWVFNSLNTDSIQIQFSSQSDLKATNRFSDDLFTLKKKAMKDETYKLYVSNSALPNADSIAYSITVIPDLNPSIQVEQFVDSIDNKLLFFVGDASDDYGLRRLTFNYRVNNASGAQGKLNTMKMEQPNGKQMQYDHTWDIAEMTLKPGDELVYYFEVFDNDGINGSKSARTNLMNFKVPTVEEFEEKEDKNNEEIKKDLKKAAEETKKIKQDMKKLQEKLMQEKEVDWQTRKELEKLLERQKELEQQIKEAKEKFEENLKNQNEFSETKEELKEKQEQVQELFEELMNDEMKELMEKIEELLQDLEKEEALDMMEEMEFNDEELEMELDRMLELFKQLEVEKEVQDQIEKLEELAKEQEELSEKTEKKEDSQENLEKKQEEIQKEVEKLKEEMKETEKKNEELERPNDLGEEEEKQEEMEDIQKDMQDSQEQMEKQENKKASKSQKKAAQKMQEMANKLSMKMKSSEMEQMEEDMDALRQLLENLVGLSFDQEALIKDLSKINVTTPRYVELVQEQYKLKDDFKLVEDSLQALSQRVFQIEAFVTEKVTDIKSNIRESLEELEERRKPNAAGHQQRAMKNVNDLALMLNEVMDQMQQQMSSMMQGSQMCTKPGGKGSSGNVPMDKIGQGQQELNKQMEQMKEGLKNGKGGMSKEFAEMAKKQSALRKALRELQQQKQEQGKGGSDGLQQILDEMNKTEIDLVNKRLNNETLKRQKDIETRLLEAEKAEREREYDNKRKAEVASEKDRKMPPKLEEYIKKRQAEIEMYRSVSPALKPYYKFLVEEYFKTLKKQ
ncbi:MAG: DUF4175 family protein [Saprospiraceae bacterium]